MYLIIGDEQNLVPMTSVYAITPWDIQEREQGCTVRLHSGQVFEIKGMSPEEVFSQAPQMSENYDAILKSFDTAQEQFADKLNQYSNQVQQYQDKLEQSLRNVIEMSEAKGTNVEEVLGKLHGTIADSRLSVKESTSKLDNVVQGLQSNNNSLTSKNMVLASVLDEVEALLKSELELLSGYDVVPPKDAAPPKEL